MLITGGTGFLGRMLVKRILKKNPKSIRVLSRDEVKHHKLLEEFNYDEKLRSLIGDVRDYERLKKATKGVDLVIHAAALKRIDILEYNVSECIQTNIAGTLNIVNACLENNIEKAIFVSTDKACSPVNTYGACKFVGERIFTESNFNKGSAKTIFSCVRYGNVMESTGSVIPFFVEKIKKNEAIPLTEKEMTRFIITPDQAVDLIFSAVKYAKGGEVFVPRLPSFKITDLIDVLKEEYNSDVEINNIGIRPGEKIHELMVNESEMPRTFVFDNNFVITSQIEKYIETTYDYLHCNNKANLKELSSKDSIISKEELRKFLIENSFLIN